MLGQSRSTHRHEPLVRNDEQAFTNDIVGLATRFGRYGYRRITALLRLAGWKVNHKRVERIWRRKGLRVPASQPRRGRLWLSYGSCLRAEAREEKPCMGLRLCADQDHGRPGGAAADRHRRVPRECLAIRAGRSIRSSDVIETLAGLMTAKGVP